MKLASLKSGASKTMKTKDEMATRVTENCILIISAHLVVETS